MTLEEVQALKAAGTAPLGLKADAGKPDYILFPWSALAGLNVLGNQDVFEAIERLELERTWELLVEYGYTSFSGVTRVLEMGAVKYLPNSWQKVRPGVRYLSAALRHLLAMDRGEELDEESGLRHGDHAGCCVLFALWMQQQGIDLWAEAD
jgi:hypothetical protein